MSRLAKVALFAVSGCVLTGLACGLGLSRQTLPDPLPHVIPFKDAPIATRLRKKIEAAAKTSNLNVATLDEVAAIGDETDRAGLVVGTSKINVDYVSSFTSRGFVNFVPVTRAVTTARDVAVNTFTEADADGRVASVEMMGVASPRIARVVIDLTDSSKIEVPLVIAGRLRYSYFTYVSTNRIHFPIKVRGYDIRNRLLSVRDITEAVKPPLSTQ